MPADTSYYSTSGHPLLYIGKFQASEVYKDICVKSDYENESINKKVTCFLKMLQTS